MAASSRPSDAPGHPSTPSSSESSSSEGASSSANANVLPNVISNPNSNSNENQQDSKPLFAPLSVQIRHQYVVLPPLCALLGLALGLSRGGRAAGHRFLAENAHRPPTTLRGWYLYKKTKNYRMLWGGLQEGGREALKLGAVGFAWAAGEDGMERIGYGAEELKEVGAGLGTGALFALVCEYQKV